jgi:hypothetical protein
MNGIILYEGPSVIDGKPIVMIATGLKDGGRNSKTGPMVQVYFLRADIHPMVAVQSGEDVSICAMCKARGKIVVNEETGKRENVERGCYVTLMHGPRMVYETYKNGRYQTVPLGQARKILKGMRVRLGAYGDPASVPFEVLEKALDQVREINGYTHSWREYPQLADFCMASVDSPEEREEAKRLGFRTFRTRSKDGPALKDEGVCPHELDKTIQCNRCMLCGGNRKPAKADIVKTIHGSGAKHYARILAGMQMEAA